MKRVFGEIKRTANWRLVTIDLSVYYQWCRSSSREPYMNNFHIILKIFFILLYLHLDQVLAATLLKIVEDWKKAIDCNQYTAAVLMDLSKAFDCLPHDLLILKLEAYGLSKSALDLMYSYLSERKQCVKVGVDFSAWENIYKGVPQGSILGLVLFKYF